MADLADKFAVGAEFQQLGGGGRVGGALGVAALADENVPLGIDRHSGNFAEIHVCRQLQHIGHGIKGNLGHALLYVSQGAEQKEQSDEENLCVFHDILTCAGRSCASRFVWLLQSSEYIAVPIWPGNSASVTPAGPDFFKLPQKRAIGYKRTRRVQTRGRETLCRRLTLCELL